MMPYAISNKKMTPGEGVDYRMYEIPVGGRRNQPTK